MNDSIFINIALDVALKKYIAYRNSNEKTINSFLVYVIYVLTYIYTEADILNPFITRNRGSKQIFESNLKRFGLSDYYVGKFYQDLSFYYEDKVKNNLNNTDFFNYLQEDLIEMFLTKYKALKLDMAELDNFKKLLISTSDNYIIKYYESKVYSLKNKIEFKEIKHNLLDKKIYDSFDLSNEKLESLSEKDVDDINNKLLKHYKYSIIEPDLNNKLIKSINNSNKNTVLKKMTKIPRSVSFALIVIVLCIITASAIALSLKIMGVI